MLGYELPKPSYWSCEVPTLYPKVNELKPSVCEGCGHLDSSEHCPYCGTPRHAQEKNLISKDALLLSAGIVTREEYRNLRMNTLHNMLETKIDEIEKQLGPRPPR